MDDRIFNLHNSISVRKYLRSNMTDQERILWSQLKDRNLGYKFWRQPGLGKYVVDFFCKERRLVIEIDGSQHLENAEYDKDRTEFLMN